MFWKSRKFSDTAGVQKQLPVSRHYRDRRTSQARLRHDGLLFSTTTLKRNIKHAHQRITMTVTMAENLTDVSNSRFSQQCKYVTSWATPKLKWLSEHVCPVQHYVALEVSFCLHIHARRPPLRMFRTVGSLLPGANLAAVDIQILKVCEKAHVSESRVSCL